MFGFVPAGRCFARISGVLGWASDGGGQVLTFCGRWMSAFWGLGLAFCEGAIIF